MSTPPPDDALRPPEDALRPPGDALRPPGDAPLGAAFGGLAELPHGVATRRGAGSPEDAPLGAAYGGLAELPHNFATGRLEELVKWSRARSCWPAAFGLACCAIEMMATGGSHYDIARYGMAVFRASPRQADLMIVAGRVSQKMAPVLRQIYDQMMAPKWVISMGVCASSGGMFNNYAIVQGVDQVVPVDVYAPGCPPGPETLLHAILTLHGLIRSGELTRRREAAPARGAGIVVDQRDGQTATRMVVSRKRGRFGRL